MRTRDFHVEALGSVLRMQSKPDTAKLTNKICLHSSTIEEHKETFGLSDHFRFY